MTDTTTKAPAKAAPAGFTLPCPYCGEKDACVAVQLAHLGDESAFLCQECQSEFGTADVRAIIGRWQALLAWVELAPQFPEQECR